jgi:hypothetical protein
MPPDQFALRLPTQSPPISRNPLANEARSTGIGVQPAQQDFCANLTGLAQQICYAATSGVNF